MKNSKITISKLSRTVKKSDINIKGFTPLTFNILYHLIIHSNEVITRENLLNSAWDNATVVTQRTVDVHINKIRNLLDSDKTNSCIESVLGIGYKFVGESYVDDSFTKSTNDNIVDGIKIGEPYRISKESKIVVVPIFVSDSKYGKLVSYYKDGKLVSCLTTEFKNSFI